MIQFNEIATWFRQFFLPKAKRIVLKVIRKPADAATSFDLTLSIKKEAIGAYIDKIWGWDDDEQYELHALEIQELQEFLLYDHETLIGYLQTQEDDARVFIFGLYFLKPYQSKGYGTSLLQEIINETHQKQKKVALEVFKINKKAQRFYKRLGFTKISTSDHHYLLWL